MARLRTALLWLVAVVACGSSASEPAPAPPPVDPGSGRLVLGEATVFEGDQPIWKLHANGNSEFFDDHGKAWRIAETFRPDGTVSFLDKVFFRITDTAITGPEPSLVLITIAGNTLTVPIREAPEGEPAQVPIVLAADGNVSVQRAGQAVVRWRIAAPSPDVMRSAFLAFGATITPRIQ